jgi:pimeloyl-ACP methyl ester carboxylesterase
VLGEERVHVIAHDYGVSVAQELLARGHVARSVVFLNGGLFPETHHATLLQKILAGPLGGLVARAIDERAFKRSFARVFAVPPGETLLDEAWALVSAGGGTQRISHRLLGYIDERRRFRERWVGALVGARVPIRLVNGLEDPVSGAHMVARFRELVREADVVELRGVGHYPQLEAPEKVLSALEVPTPR